MRILHVLDHSLPLQSGYVFRTMGILRAQRSLGWETIQLTAPNSQLDSSAPAEEIDDFRFYRTPDPKGLTAHLPVAGRMSTMKVLERRIEDVSEQTKPDVIHAHSPVLNAIPALRVGRARGIPVVYEIRAFWEDAAVDHGTAQAWGPRYRLTRSLETRALRRVSAATTICQGLRTDIIERGIPADKITVIPNSIDLEHFSSPPAYDPQLAESLGLTGSIVIGFIGSFYAYEGLDLLLEALPRLVESVPNLKVVLVGGGQDLDRLTALAESKGVADRVIFTGRVDHQDVPRYYGLIDVMIYPRHGQRLTELVTPLKPLEAMANGRVLLASDVGGHRELIEHGKTGFLFKADDVNDLATSLEGIIAQRQTWDQIRRAGRAFIEQERTWQTTVKRYQGVYDYALNGAK